MVAVAVAVTCIVTLMTCNRVARDRAEVECDANRERLRDEMVRFYCDHGVAPSNMLQIIDYDDFIARTACPTMPVDKSETGGDYWIVLSARYERYERDPQGNEELVYSGPDVVCRRCYMPEPTTWQRFLNWIRYR